MRCVRDAVASGRLDAIHSASGERRARDDPGLDTLPADPVVERGGTASRKGGAAVGVGVGVWKRELWLPQDLLLLSILVLLLRLLLLLLLLLPPLVRRVLLPALSLLPLPLLLLPLPLLLLRVLLLLLLLLLPYSPYLLLLLMLLPLFLPLLMLLLLPLLPRGEGEGEEGPKAVEWGTLLSRLIVTRLAVSLRQDRQRGPGRAKVTCLPGEQPPCHRGTRSSVRAGRKAAQGAV